MAMTYKQFNKAEGRNTAVVLLHILGTALSGAFAVLALILAVKHLDDIGLVLGIVCSVMFIIQGAMHCFRLNDRLKEARRLDEYKQSVFPK
jgi:hypothetical protein